MIIGCSGSLASGESDHCHDSDDSETLRLGVTVTVAPSEPGVTDGHGVPRCHAVTDRHCQAGSVTVPVTLTAGH